MQKKHLLLLPTYAVFLLISFCFLSFHSHAAESSDTVQEVSQFMGESISESRNYFENMSEPSWVMGTTLSKNELIILAGTGNAADQDLINKITLTGSNNPYSVYGTTTDMSIDYAGSLLFEQGFQKIYTQNIFYNQSGRFVELDQTAESELKIILSEVAWEIHSDKTEVFSYIGCTIEELQQRISGLLLSSNGDSFSLQKEGLEFIGTMDNKEPLQSQVSRIIVSGLNCEYCIYGILPGSADWEIGSALNFSSGGSGEYFDPSGNILNLYYLNDSDNPRIELISPAASQHK